MLGLSHFLLAVALALALTRGAWVLGLGAFLALDLLGGFVASSVGLGPEWTPDLAGSAVALAACLAAPLATVDASAWASSDPTPTPREARAITGALLENMVRAFNTREEEAVHDRLALSLDEAV